MGSSRFEWSPPPALRWIGQALADLDPRDWRPETPTAAAAMGIHALRTGLFFAESLPLAWIERPDAGSRLEAPPAGALEVTVSRLMELLRRDAELIGSGQVPISVLSPLDAAGHGGRWLRILSDAMAVSNRRKKHRAREFSVRAQTFLDDLPAYYRRNFHYQTDGYLSEQSADLYEHQVELLFRGGADAMRRMIVSPMKRAFGDGQGRGLRLLELGSGTGAATASVARAFPEAQITCVDLSHPYTKRAARRLSAFDRVDCLRGDAAELDFADDRFDAVYSVFLFHELPLPVREAVLDEAKRVLKPDGFFGFVDSLQTGDDPELDWALEFFPHAFHEPYYAHYAAHPMRDLLAAAGFEGIEMGTGYLAKWMAARA